jgi:uroporphyrinogen decarboxylase
MMHSTSFNELVLRSPRRPAIPIAVYPGIALTGARVVDIVTNARAQFEAQDALRQRHNSPFALTAMDLSVEAEAFGCGVTLSDTEVPTITGRLVSSLDQARALAVPEAGDRRTSVALEAVRLLAQLPDKPFILGGCIGPFSLAGRLLGVSEALEMTLSEPAVVHALLEKCTAFLSAYVNALRDSGACGVIMAEPAAGLLSPAGLLEFSSRYVRQLSAETKSDAFTILLHNCAARRLHLPAILETGLNAFHFGAPMDIVEALSLVPHNVVLCGNLDPTAVFVQMTPDEISGSVGRLLAATASSPNFAISSGCDLPPTTPIAALDAFYRAVDAASSG